MFDFGMRSSQAEGAGEAQANYALDGQLMTIAGVPVGSEGLTLSHADLTKWFRIKPGADGQQFTEEGSIWISVMHEGGFGDGTNFYNIIFGIMAYSADGVLLGSPRVLMTDGDSPEGRLLTAGLCNQVFFADPEPHPTDFPLGPPYKPGRLDVIFNNCKFEAGKFYAVTISLNVSVAGNPPEPESGVPARGGRVTFLGGVPGQHCWIDSIDVEG